MAEEWITGKDAAELLGMQQNNFLYYVKSGEIAIRPGAKERMREYSREDTLKVGRRLARKKRAVQEQPLIDWVGASDVPIALLLSQQVYDEEVDLQEAALYASWRKNNDKITIGAFNQERTEVYATVQLVPLPEKIILDVLAGRREESSIAPDEIESYDRPGAYTLLCTSVTALKSRPHLLYELLYRYTQFWLKQYPERYIHKIYAQTVSESGAMLAQHMFMAPRPDLAYNAFELNLLWPPASKLIRQFKQQMEEKAPLPDALRWPPVQSHQEAPHAPQPVKHQRSTLWSQEAITANEHVQSSMPDGLIPLATFFDQHGISESTARRGIDKQFKIAPGGPWIIGGFQVKQVLDQTGQHQFYEAYHDKASFTPCPLCPHVNQSPAPEVSAPNSGPLEDA